MTDEHIESWLTETVSTCPWCEAPVTRISPRGLDYQDRICCLSCLDKEPEGPCRVCRAPITRREGRETVEGSLIHSACAQQEKRR